MTENVTAVEWYPADGSAKVTFTRSWPFKLRDIQGIDATLAQVLSRKNPSQTGATAVDVEVGVRVVPIQLQVAAETEEGLWALRRQLVRALVASPARPGESVALGTLRLLRGDLPAIELRAVPRNSPQGSKSKGIPLYEADLEFEAPYPYWRDTVDQSVNFAQTDGGFEFELEFPLEMVGNNVEQEVDNMGDVDAPIRVQLHGDCTVARFINVTTGETLEVSGQIEAGDYIEVTTGYGEKDVVLVESDGTRSSAMARLNLDLADFWSLRPGLNTIRFEADTNVSGTARLFWRQRYAGA